MADRWRFARADDWSVWLGGCSEFVSTAAVLVERQALVQDEWLKLVKG
jgi:hypothetical protein